MLTTTGTVSIRAILQAPSGNLIHHVTPYTDWIVRLSDDSRDIDFKQLHSVSIEFVGRAIGLDGWIPTSLYPIGLDAAGSSNGADDNGVTWSVYEESLPQTTGKGQPNGSAGKADTNAGTTAASAPGSNGNGKKN